MYPALSIGSCCFTLISCRIHLRRQSSRLLDITFFTGQEKRAPTQPGAQAHRHGAVVTPAGCPAPAERRALTSGKPNPVQMPCSPLFFLPLHNCHFTLFFLINDNHRFPPHYPAAQPAQWTIRDCYCLDPAGPPTPDGKINPQFYISGCFFFTHC